MGKGKEKKRVTKRARSEFLWGWMFILPTMTGLMILNIIPIIQTIWQSFFKTGAFGRGNIFIGLENYQRLFADDSIWQALINTFKYAIVEVPFSIAIALVIAVMLNSKMRGRSTYRAIYFLPMVVAPAAVAMVWKWLFNSEFGLLNHILNSIGLKSVHWLSDPNIAIYSIAVVGIWGVIGYNMVLFLAGLQEIPRDYYEAAEIDGANAFQQFFKITLPMLKPITYLVVTLGIIWSFQVFDLAYLMTGGGPGRATVTLVMGIYNAAFKQYKMGYACAMAMLLLLIVVIINVIENLFFKERKGK